MSVKGNIQMKNIYSRINSQLLILIPIVVIEILFMSINAESVFASRFDDVESVISSVGSWISPSNFSVKKRDGSIWTLNDNSTTANISSEKDIVKKSYCSGTRATLYNNGNLLLSGGNTCGEIGNGNTNRVDIGNEFNVASVISGKIIDVETGNQFTAALTEDGDLYMWGLNNYGQIGNMKTSNQLEPLLVMENVKKISLGLNHAAALMKDGSLWLWGNNEYGQLGTGGSMQYNSVPKKIIDSGVEDISLGHNHSSAVKDDGSLWTWGDNQNGQLGNNTTTSRNEPYHVNADARFKSVHLCYDVSSAIDDTDRLWVWGYNEYCNPLTSVQKTPVIALSGVKDVDFTYYNCIAVLNSGFLSVWGKGHGKNPGDIYGDITEDSDDHVDGDILASDLTDIKKMVIGGEYMTYNYTMVLKKDGTMWSWGSNFRNRLGYTHKSWAYSDDGKQYGFLERQYSAHPNKVTEISDVIDFDISSHTEILAVKKDGTVWKKPEGLIEFDQISGLKNVKEVSCGNSHYAALTEEGALYVWGNNSSGQIGDGSQTNRIEPYEVEGLGRITKMDLGSNHTVALNEDGCVYVWGLNSDRQIGDGSSDNSSEPVRVMLDEGAGRVVAIRAQGSHTAAVTENGSLYMWGRINDKTVQTPQCIIYKENIKDVQLGTNHFAVVNTNGELSMWGSNTHHQIPELDGDSITFPTKVLKESTITSVALGSVNSGVISPDNTIMLWGDDSYGQLGDGSIGEGSSDDHDISADAKGISVDEVVEVPGSVDDDKVLFKFTPSVSGKYLFNSFGSETADPDCDVLILNDNKFSSIAWDNNSGDNEMFAVYFDGVAGQDYYLEVNGDHDGWRNDSFSVRLTRSDVTSISLTPKTPYVVDQYENGRWRDHDEDGFFFEYFAPAFEDGDVFTVTKDGASVEFVYNAEKKAFVSEGEEDIPEDQITCSKEFLQPDQEGKFTYRYKGCTASVPVKLNGVDIISISYRPSHKYEYIENDSKNGFWENEDTDDKYFRYFTPSFADGDALIINTSDKTKEYIYDASKGMFIYGAAFIDTTDPDDWQPFSLRTNQQEKHWTVGSDNELTIRFGKFTGIVTEHVTIIAGGQQDEKGTLKIQVRFNEALTDEEKGNISFTIKGPDGFTEQTKKYSDLADGEWELGEVPIGKYTITETGDEKEGYTLIKTYSVDGKAADKAEIDVSKDKAAVFAISHTYQKKVQPIDLKPTVKLSKTVYAYNKKNIRPKPVVMVGTAKLKLNKDYTVKYNKKKSSEVGSYKLTVKGRGEYEGKISNSLKYNIVPDKPKISKVKQSRYGKTLFVEVKPGKFKIKPSKKNKVYYQLEIYKSKKLGKKNKFNKFTFHYKDLYHNDKYHKNGTFEFMDKKTRRFKRGETYYVRMLTVKKVGKKKYKSEWSKVKSFKAK